MLAAPEAKVILARLAGGVDLFLPIAVLVLVLRLSQ
jgi:hypothetical protein